ncbi:LysR family transcriptional regulator [Roseibium algae]|uniref:LysR family transcriptional regulator n=1 Tax=Roseibium algae TaxID=3123038 RepID=A0ABU8TIB3_9HYPH
MLDDITLFVHIVQAGGLAAAASRLQIPPATVTRRLRKLEEGIGCKLIHRSARKFALTAEGEAYYQAFGALVHQFEGTARSLSADLHQVTGPLTVAAPTNISVKLLQPMWSAFMKEHPRIQLELRLSNGFTDLASIRADLAMRIGPQPDSQLYQIRLGTVATIVVASPDYLGKHGHLAGPEDLASHSIIGVRSLPTWDLSNISTGQKALFQLTAATVVDDIGMACQLACDGLGIVLLPVSEIETEVSDGRLVHVLGDWQGQRRDLFAVWPSGRLLGARAKCLRDFMQSSIREIPVLQGEVPSYRDP